jgi:hypothetical protein
MQTFWKSCRRIRQVKTNVRSSLSIDRTWKTRGKSTVKIK